MEEFHRRCVAYRCPDDAEPGRPLCRQHRRRLERGEGLPKAGDLVKGDPSGYGLYGVLESTEHGIKCHECGNLFVSLGQHARRAHQISANEYRERHGVRGSLLLPPSPGATDGTRRRRPRPCQCGAILTTTAKSCPDCRRRRAEKRAQPKPAARRRWRDLTDAERNQILESTEGELGRLIEQLQQDRVTSKQIGAVLGRSQWWMSKHWPLLLRVSSRASATETHAN